jgi:hypothetical protein
MRPVPWFWRLTPLIHLFIAALLIANGMLYAAPVEGYTAPPEVRRLPKMAACSTWIYQSGTTQANSGYPAGTLPRVQVNWTVKRNGCSIVPVHIRCSAFTVAVSAKFEWCSSYRLSSTQIVVGATWQACTSPIQGWGACWGQYVRQEVRANGTVGQCWPDNGPPFWPDPYMC